MFAHLNGSVARIAASYIVLDVGGVGYKVAVPVSALATLPPLGAKAFLYIHTQVREDDISLFGFMTLDDQHLFELLLSVTGIGPKVALSILSAMDAESVCRAITNDDTKTLIRIPGLGLKTAQRLVLELREKVTALTLERRADSKLLPSQSPEADLFDDVVEGLVNLGYNRNEARKAADRALKEITDKTSMGEALRAALNILTGAGGK
jgi:Holliday junction DNA helicase RuvA